MTRKKLKSIAAADLVKISGGSSSVKAEGGPAETRDGKIAGTVIRAEGANLQ